MTLTVVTYNIGAGGSGRVAQLAAILRSTDADAVALLEASEHGVARQLAGVLGMRLVFGESDGPLGMHVAWLTRLPVRGAENHRLPQLSKTLLEIEVEWEGSPLRLFATHLASRHEEEAYPRDAEAAAIIETLAGAGDRHLLVGDLNALRPGESIGTPPPDVEPRGDALPGAPRTVLRRFLDAGYVDCFRRANGARGYTYPAAAPWLRLDYALATPTLAAHLLSCDVYAEEPAGTASDHLPLVTAFR